MELRLVQDNEGLPASREAALASREIDRAVARPKRPAAPPSEPFGEVEQRWRVLLAALAGAAIASLTWGLVGVAWRTGQPTYTAISILIAFGVTAIVPHLLSCGHPRWRRP